MFRSNRLILMSLVFLALGLTLTACRSPRPKTQTLPGYRTIRLNRVAVMPFLAGLEWTGADSQVAHPLDCTLVQFCEAVNELGAGAEDILTHEMQMALERRLDYRVMPRALSARTFDNMPQNRTQDTPRNIARRFGRAMGADHVILGKIWRFREREANLGASAGFMVYLVQVDNGRRVWQGRFDRTQTTLFEDLRESRIFFKEGARWLSAEELSRFGIEQMLETFPQVAE
ncbi:MAG: hypothetical protein JJV98_13020 [Desulfosarcina sp.]|nr:hypothetical protein [Desulfobacterales bacterium]